MIAENKVDILFLVEGAKKAEGLVVVIDVFRAFSLEAYLFDMGAIAIMAVETLEDAFQLKQTTDNSLLIGERCGKKCEGFDYGNSPSVIERKFVEGKNIIHTTSSGTRGLLNVNHADELIAGSLVNARAIADYILKKSPERVSLVCMGDASKSPAEEDVLCAQYIKYLITGNNDQDYKKKIQNLKNTSGSKFFDAHLQEIYPERDFWMCTNCNIFPFVLIANKEKIGMSIKRKWIKDIQ